MITKHAVLLIKKRDRLLVIKDKGWGCFLFPHFRIERNVNAGDVFQYVNNKFGDVKARYVFAFSEKVKKKNVPETKNSTYWHYYYLIEITDDNSLLCNDRFIADGDEYVWLQLEKLKADEATSKYNSEVIASVEKFFRGNDNGYNNSSK